MTYEEGLFLARRLIKKQAHFALPQHLGDDFLELIIQCSRNEENPQIALPMMMVLHLWRHDKKPVTQMLFSELHQRFLIYRDLCIKEYQSRHPNVISFKTHALKVKN